MVRMSPVAIATSQALCPSSQGRAAVGSREQVERKSLWTPGWPCKPSLTNNPELAGLGKSGGMGGPIQRQGPPRVGVQLGPRRWDGPDQGWAELRMGLGSAHGGVQEIVDGSVQDGGSSDWGVIRSRIGV